MARVFTKRNGSHPANYIAQATQSPEWNNPNCRVAPPWDEPLPSFFRRGSWVSHSSCQPDTGQQVANNSSGNGWHLHLRRCGNPPQLWLPAQCQETQFRGRPEGVAAPRPPHVPGPGTGGVSALHVAPRARASPGLAPGAALAAWRRCAAARHSPAPGGLGLLCCSRSALSSSSNPLPSPAPATRGRGPTARWERRASWRPGMFFHKGRAAEEEADKKMPLSPPPQGDHAESSPSRTPKKHTPFHIWRSKKKQQPLPSDCGVFVPHPPPEPLSEAR